VGHGLDVSIINGLAALALIALALYLVVTALVKLRAERRAALIPEPT
jgi:hypothetical protein